MRRTGAEFRFRRATQDFLPATRFRGAFEYPFDGHPSVKDALEAIGVPHPEVDLVLVNGAPVAFTHPLQAGDRVSAYPRFHAVDVGDISLVRPAPIPEPRFLLDTHLGRLAAYVRLAGFDATYGRDWDDETLAETSRRERRILLTRDVALLKRSVIDHGYYLRHTDPRRQLAEVVERYDLAAAACPFTRCLRCNGEIEPVSKATVLDRLPPRTREHYHEFWRCPRCARVYWKGSHFEWMRRLLAGVI